MQKPEYSIKNLVPSEGRWMPAHEQLTVIPNSTKTVKMANSRHGKRRAQGADCQSGKQYLDSVGCDELATVKQAADRIRNDSNSLHDLRLDASLDDADHVAHSTGDTDAWLERPSIPGQVIAHPGRTYAGSFHKDAVLSEQKAIGKDLAKSSQD
jgi:hypothetical protein